MQIAPALRSPDTRDLSAIWNPRDFSDGLRVQADLDPALLLDETVDLEVGFEAFDGKAWRTWASVGYDGGNAVRALEQGIGKQITIPSIVIPAPDLEALRRLGFSCRTFVQIRQTRADDRIAKVAVRAGAVVLADSLSRVAPAHEEPHSVAFDASASTTITGTSGNYSHTCTGSNLSLHYGMSGDDTANLNATGSYNAVAGTRLSNLSGSYYLAHWRNLAPATGAHSIAHTWTGATDASFVAMSFSGVDQTTPDGTPVTSASAGDTQRSDNVSSNAGDMVVDVISVNNRTAAQITIGAGQTMVAVDNAGNGACAMSYEVGGATVTMSATWAVSNRCAHSAVNVLQVSGGGGASVVPVLMYHYRQRR